MNSPPSHNVPVTISDKDNLSYHALPRPLAHAFCRDAQGQSEGDTGGIIIRMRPWI